MLLKGRSLPPAAIPVSQVGQATLLQAGYTSRTAPSDLDRLDSIHGSAGCDRETAILCRLNVERSSDIALIPRFSAIMPYLLCDSS
jgi:hypothetical protein